MPISPPSSEKNIGAIGCPKTSGPDDLHPAGYRSPKKPEWVSVEMTMMLFCQGRRERITTDGFHGGAPREGMETIVAEIRIPGPPEPIWQIISDPALLHALTPRELALSPTDSWPDTFTKGQVIQFNIRTFGLPILWACELVEIDPPRKIIARQRTSPFRFWQFTETLFPVGNDTAVEERMCYDVAGGSLTTAMTAPLLVPKIEQIIAFRQDMIRQMVRSAPLSTSAPQNLRKTPSHSHLDQNLL